MTILDKALRRREAVLWLLMSLVLLWLGGAQPVRAVSPGVAAARSVTLVQRGADFTILTNGDVLVVETWKVAFHGGPFHYAFRSIPYRRLEGVDGWDIAEGERTYRPASSGEPYTFDVTNAADASKVTWYFPETTDATRTFTLRYTLHGVLWLDAGRGDRFFWTFVEAERGYPVEAARATVHLPAEFPADAVEVRLFRDGEEQAQGATVLDGRTVTFQAADLADGETLEIGVRWPHGAVTAEPPTWQLEAMKRVEVAQRALSFQVLANGKVRTTDSRQLHFQGGPFASMTEIMDDQGLDGLSEWDITVDGQPCVQKPQEGACEWAVSHESWFHRYVLTLAFPPTVNRDRTFVIAYTQEGAIQQSKAGDVFTWRAQVPDDTPLDMLEIRVHLPQNLPREEVRGRGEVVWGGESRALPGTYDNGTLVFTAAEVPAGARLALQVQWPHGLIQAPLPQWQQHLIWQRRVLVWGGALVLLFTGAGLAAILGLWYLRGRDPAVGQSPAYLTTPPDDLPPGLVGVLLDEKAHTRDVLATVWDLARRGFLTLSVPLSLKSTLSENTLLTRRTHAPPLKTLRPYERQVLRAIFPRGVKTEGVVTLQTAQKRLARAQESIKQALYTEAVKEGLFERSPGAVRARMKKWAWLFVLLLGGMSCVVLPLLVPDEVSDVVVWFWGSALLLAVVALWVAPRMPRKTRRGALAASRWRAFRRYLLQLRRFAAQSGMDVSDKFALYLPYATAFGLARNLAMQFSALPGAQLPKWLEVIAMQEGAPSGAGLAGASGADGGGLKAPVASGGEAPLPALDTMASGVFRHLARVADDIFDHLNVAAGGTSSGFSSSGSHYSSFGGGSWSSSGGGGFSGGGSSGGGSSGFG